MATKTEYEVDESVNGIVKDYATLQQMQKDGQLKPFSNYFTPDEDENVSCLRVETLYDMTGKSASNWGYSNGIENNVNVTGKDFSKYDKLMFYCARLDANSDIANSGVVVVDLNIIHPHIGVYTGSTVTMLNSSSVMFGDCVRVYVGPTKTEFTAYMTEYTSGPNSYTTGNLKINKIEGILKEPAMIYTGAELYEGDGIEIKDGVISSKSILLYSGTITSSSTNIDLSGFDLGKGTYDVQIMGTCGSEGTGTLFRVNNDSSATYYTMQTNNYNTTAPTGGYNKASTSFPAGGIWNHRAFYNITLTVTDENVLTYSFSGCGLAGSSASTGYNRVYNGIKINLADNKLKSIQYGVDSGSAIIYAYIKIYKRY